MGTSNEVKPYDSNDDLQRALQLSLTAEDNQTNDALEDVEMKRAIELSLRATTSSHSLGNESNEKQKKK